MQLEQERLHAEALADSIQQQDSIEVEQREFQATAEGLQQQLREQVLCLQQQLKQQEKEAREMREDLYQQVEMTDKAKEEVQKELRAAHDTLRELRKQLQETVNQKDELKLAASRMSRQREETQVALQAQERKLQQVQEKVQELLQQIDGYVSKEAAYIAEGEALRGNIGQLELSVQAAKEETERQLAEKEQDMKQLEKAQQTAMAVLQQQIEQLEAERAQALANTTQDETAVLGHEYEALKETVSSLREQNANLLGQLQLQQQTRIAQEEEQQQWHHKYEALRASLGDAQDRYRQLELLLERSYMESHKSLQEAQQQLQQMLLKDSQCREPQLKEHLHQPEMGCQELQMEVSGLRARHATAPQPSFEVLEQQEEVIGGDEMRFHRQVEMRETEASQMAQETHKPLQQLLSSLREQRQQFEEAADRQKLLIAANERMRKENQQLKVRRMERE